MKFSTASTFYHVTGEREWAARKAYKRH